MALQPHSMNRLIPANMNMETLCSWTELQRVRLSSSCSMFLFLTAVRPEVYDEEDTEVLNSIAPFSSK